MTAAAPRLNPLLRNNLLRSSFSSLGPLGTAHPTDSVRPDFPGNAPDRDIVFEGRSEPTFADSHATVPAKMWKSEEKSLIAVWRGECAT
jgi:hypothetical protein